MEAMGGAADWCVRNHSALIGSYEELIARCPSEPRPYWFLLDQLIDDGRLTEAETVLDTLERIDYSYRPALYRGRVAARAGQTERAADIFRQVRERWPEDWRVSFDIPGTVITRLS